MSARVLETKYAWESLHTDKELPFQNILKLKHVYYVDRERAPNVIIQGLHNP